MNRIAPPTARWERASPSRAAPSVSVIAAKPAPSQDRAHNRAAYLPLGGEAAAAIRSVCYPAGPCSAASTYRQSICISVGRSFGRGSLVTPRTST